MCGIIGIIGGLITDNQSIEPRLAQMIARQHHRGPDAQGSFVNPAGNVALGHNRLSIIDLSELGRQPMANHDGSVVVAFNGEIYNYRELRQQLSDYPYRSQTDTEVILAAYERWGTACLDRFIGMFAWLLWDERQQTLFAARDRFGVKPLYYATADDGALLFASEIKTLHAAGLPRVPDAAAWATFLKTGLYDHSARSFWQGVSSLPAGHSLTWHHGQSKIEKWYDFASLADAPLDERTHAEVIAEYVDLLSDSVRLRFRADVPVGINLSGGLDSSTLLGLVQRVQGADSTVKAFTFTTGDDHYDELPWVRQMLAHTQHPISVCQLNADEVPELALSVQAHQDEPFGGLPTLAYAKIFERARQEGVIVLLDGQGMDEQWAGYDYYRRALSNQSQPASIVQASLVQGSQDSPVRPECLTPEFAALAEAANYPQPFPDALRNLQYRDIRCTKIPRALRFNDRVSMRASTELREPFLDHRLFELALRQPAERKIQGATHKWLVRQLAAQLLPAGVVEAPKRPLQTPQREWLRGPLWHWANEMIETGLSGWARDWLDARAIQAALADYRRAKFDNSFFVWQWVSLGLLSQTK
jgi:asparagine synthase (glutamine-hydrolysing)